MPRTPLVGIALLASLCVIACDGCRKDKPYTPFGVTSALPTASAPPSASAEVEGTLSPSAPAKMSVFAPTAARRFALEGREIESPPNRVFEQLLADDFDADGARDIAAWTLADGVAKDVAPGELWFFPATGAPRKILDFPAFLPTGPECTPVAALSEPSPGALAMDVRVACSSGLIARAPTRALSIVSTAGDGGPRFGLRAADPAPGETLGVELAVGDEDGDGRADFRVKVSLGLSSKLPLVRAQLVFLDRAAGISRDAREPGRSLLDAFKNETGRARQKKTAPAVLERVSSARRLLASVCAEGATPRVFDWSGAPFACPSISELLDRLASLEVSAHLALGDGLGALGVLARDGWYFSPLREKTRAALTKEIEKKLTVVQASRSRLDFVPKRGPVPGYSSLAFDGSGALLVDTESGVHRVGKDGTRERVGDDAGSMSWPREVNGPGGERLAGVSYSCDRSEVALLLIGGPGEPQVTSLLAPRPGLCGGRRFVDAFTPAPVRASAGFEVLVGGALLGAPPSLASAIPQGSPRSPNGRVLIAPTALGLFLSGERSELWKPEGFNGLSASGCVVDNEGVRAACLRDNQVERYVREATASQKP